MLGWDTETEPIAPGRQAPPLVCLSVSDGTLVKWDRSVELAAALLDSGQLLGGHNTAFDWAVIANQEPRLLPKIFTAYEEARICDTGVRQKLIDLAHGELRGWLRTDGPPIKIGYALDDIAKRLLNVTLDKSTYRLRYGELRHVPLEAWPEGAKLYAIEDAKVLVPIYEHQERYADLLADQFRQTRAAFWLRLASIWGLHTDVEEVRKFTEKTRVEYDQLARGLIEIGLLRPSRALKSGPRRGTIIEGSRDTKAAAIRLVAAYAAAGKSAPLTPHEHAKLDEASCLASGDPVLKNYARLSSLKKTLGTDIPMLESGVSWPIHTHYDELKETGRTGSSGPNIQNLPTDFGVRDCFIARPGHVFAFADYSGFELRTWSQVCMSVLGFSNMAKVLNAGGDPHLSMASTVLECSYQEAAARFEAGDKDAYKARQVGKVCFHPDTEVFTRLGWKNITQLTMQDQVCSAQLADDGTTTLEWELPLALTNRSFDGDLVHLKNEGIDLRVTPDHRMCGWEKLGGGRRGLTVDRVTTCSPDRLTMLRYWPNAGMGPGAFSADERLLRLAVAVQADGSAAEGKIRLGFTKQRKIDRLRGLLKEDEYTFKLIGKMKVSTFTLTNELSNTIRSFLTPDKQFPWWWIELTKKSREVVLEEVRFWDSHTGKNSTGYEFTSIHEQNADVLQAIATLTNSKSRKTPGINPRGRPYFNVSIKNKHRSRGGNLIPRSVPYAGLVYCLTTRNDTIVVRDGGVPIITRQCNFGLPGGLGVESMVEFAAKGYGVILTPEMSQSLKEQWKSTWPEARAYFKWIGDLAERNFPVLEQLFSGRYRGRASYTEMSNSAFQGLASDAAKTAGWLIARACYVDQSSVLYGSRCPVFVHDEFGLEVPIEIASECAHELARLMQVGAAPWLPDVPPVVGAPVLMKHWSKKAKPVYDANGRLTLWEPKK